jgi:DedD protein
MAKPVSEEELQLKKRARRRLIGAVALVAGTAAVLPMVLDSEPKPTSQDINIQIPSPEAKGAITSKVVPAPPRADKGAPAAKAAGTAAEALPAAKLDAAPKSEPEEKAAEAKPSAPAPVPTPKPAVEKAPLKGVDKTTDKTADKAPEKKPEKTAERKPKSGSFFIQVVALAEPDKARQVQQQIVEAGVRAYTEVVTTESGKVTRVRAGPFASREAAERARAKLQGAGLEGKIASN